MEIKIRSKKKWFFLLFCSLMIYGPSVFAQETTISGTIYDSEKNEVLPGVNIMVKGTTIGTTSDMDGNYQLNVPSLQDTLIFTFIGFQRQVVPIRGRTEIDMQLVPQTIQGEEMVVVGYGTQQQQNLSGAISSVDASEIQKREVTATGKSLQGMAPGLTVIDRGGMPGENQVDIRIRGIGNFGYPDPLYIVDGIPQDINDINPNNIASISVLKDAAASAIYGSRAANGVIVVKTKRGQMGSFQVNYDGYVGVQQPTVLPERVGIGDYLRMVNVAYENAGAEPKFSQEYIQNSVSGKNPYKYPNTQWFDVAYDPAIQYKHNISFSGGSKIGDEDENKSFRYNVSMSYLNQDGMFVANSHFKRYNFRANTDLKLSKDFSLKMDLSVRRENQVEPHNADNVFFRLLHDNPPTFPAKYPDGSYGISDSNHNLLADMERGALERVTNYYTANISAEWDLSDHFTVRGNFSPKVETNNEHENIKSVYFYDYYKEGKPLITSWTPNSVWEHRDESLEYYLQGFAEYNQTFLGVHNVKAMLGSERVVFNYDEIEAGREEAYNNQLPAINAGNSETDFNSGYSDGWRLASLFGRLNYNYDKRYILEANFRYDGSSRFASGRRWGFFPSFSGAWTISEEEFMEDVDFIDFLKIRGSWGRLGHQAIDEGLFQYLAPVTVENTYVFGESAARGAYQTRLANKSISWESTEQANIGLNLTVLDGKLSLTADVYRKLTEGVLLELPIPDVVGLTAPYQNAGRIENKGWELSLTHNNNIGSDFTYSATFNLSDNLNKVLDMHGAGPIIDGSTIRTEGVEMDAIYGYRAEGLFNTQEELENNPKLYPDANKPGDVRFYDLNNDGQITPEGDREVLASSQPHYQTSMNLSVGWKQFDLSMFWQGVLSQRTIIAGALTEGPNWENFTTPAMLDYWNPQNKDASWPRHERYSVRSQQGSTFWVKNTSYVRLKNLTLGYRLAPSLVQKLGIRSARFYVSGDNLLTISPAKYIDPEAYNNSRVTYYPQTMTLTAGVNISF